MALRDRRSHSAGLSRKEKQLLKSRQDLLAFDHEHDTDHHRHRKAQDAIDNMHLPTGLQVHTKEPAEAISKTRRSPPASRQSSRNLAKFIAETEGELDNELLGLPGRLNLTEHTTKKYFGELGRENFFDRYHWLARQAEISTPADVRHGPPGIDLVFDEAPPCNTTIPFGPVRLQERHTYEQSVKLAAHYSLGETQHNETLLLSWPSKAFQAEHKQVLLDEHSRILRSRSLTNASVMLQHSTMRSESQFYQSDSFWKEADPTECAEWDMKRSPRSKKKERRGMKSSFQSDHSSSSSDSDSTYTDTDSPRSVGSILRSSLRSHSVSRDVHVRRRSVNFSHDVGSSTRNALDSYSDTPFSLSPKRLSPESSFKPPINPLDVHRNISARSGQSTGRSSHGRRRSSIITPAGNIIPDPLTIDPVADQHTETYDSVYEKYRDIPQEKRDKVLSTLSPVKVGAALLYSSKPVVTQDPTLSATLPIPGTELGPESAPSKVDNRQLYEFGLLEEGQIASTDLTEAWSVSDIDTFGDLNAYADRMNEASTDADADAEADADMKLKPRSRIPGHMANLLDRTTKRVLISAENIHAARDGNGQDGRVDGTASPRSLFLAACVHEKVCPRSLIVRRHLTKRLDLAGQSIGDNMARILGHSLAQLPYVESINVASNRLTDDGLVSLLNGVLKTRGLLELDLSDNVVGPLTSRLLREWIQNPDCQLIRMVLGHADVDDYECKRIVDALLENVTLEELVLSRNLIGSSENLSMVKPNHITGGEAFAKLLASENCNLKTLNIDWNMIRLHSASVFCDSVGMNKSLVNLDLSYNKIANDGGTTLGRALLNNLTLKNLNVAHNGIGAAACLTIAAGIIENVGLTHVVLDGNPISEQGSRAVMIIPLMKTNRVYISLRECNVQTKDPSCRFDFDTILGDYTLHMEDPVERAIVLILLRLTSNHYNYRFTKFVHVPPAKGRRAPRGEKVELIEGLTKNELDAMELKIRANWQLLLDITRDTKRIDELFRAAAKRRRRASARLKKSEVFKLIGQESLLQRRRGGSAEGSGNRERSNSSEINIALPEVMHKDELADFMRECGINVDMTNIKELVEEFDINGDGNIDREECMLMIKAAEREARLRIRELDERPMIISTETAAKMNTKGKEKTVLSNEHRYVPPTSGTLSLSIASAFERKDVVRVMTAFECASIIELAKECGHNDPQQLLFNSLPNSAVRKEEALAIYEELDGEIYKLKTICRILPKLNSPDDTVLFIKDIGINPTEYELIQRELGNAFKAFTADYDGYYSLNLLNPMDRLCFERLMELTSTSRSQRIDASKLGSGILGDTSQFGNWSCFRNEHYNGQHLLIDDAFAANLPLTGKLDFDYVSCSRPDHEYHLHIADERFISMLSREDFLSEDHKWEVLHHLTDDRKEGDRCLDLSGSTMYSYKTSHWKSKKMANYKYRFYANMHTRFPEPNKAPGKMDKPSSKPPKTARRHRYTDTDLDIYTRETAYLDNDDYDVDDLSSAASSTASDEYNLNKVDSPKTSPRLTPRRGSVSGNVGLTSQGDKSLSARRRGSLSTRPGRPTEEPDVGANREPFANNTSPPAEETSGAGMPVGAVRRSGVQSIAQVAKMMSHFGGILDDVRDNLASENSQQGDWDSESVTPRSPMRRRSITTNKTIPPQSSPGPRRGSVGGRRGSFLGKKKSMLPGAHNMVMHLDPLHVRLREIKNLQAQVSMNRVYGKRSRARSRRFVNKAKLTFPRVAVECRHIALLIGIFGSDGRTKSSKMYGTFNVEIIIFFFSRIVDLHNFELVLMHLTAFELACLHCRLGILNFFNPCKPDGSHHLDINYYDERQVLKIIFSLVYLERYYALLDHQYRFSKEKDPMRGWTLTTMWLEEPSIGKRGCFQIRCGYQDPSLTNTGTGDSPDPSEVNKVDKSLRKSLMNLTLLSEKDVVTAVREVAKNDAKGLYPNLERDALTHTALNFRKTLPSNSGTPQLATKKKKKVITVSQDAFNFEEDPDSMGDLSMKEKKEFWVKYLAPPKETHAQIILDAKILPYTERLKAPAPPAPKKEKKHKGKKGKKGKKREA